jgi:precorrin-2 dehydrogenase/sirohydrochlorin ferrochelatase
LQVLICLFWGEGMYPINVELTGKKCLVIGGGAVANRKIKSLLKAGGEVTIIAPEVCPELQNIIHTQNLTWFTRNYKSNDTHGYFLVVCASSDKECNDVATKEALKQNLLVNNVTNPPLGNFTVPASTSKGDLTLTIATNGKSPEFARVLCKHYEKELGEDYTSLLEFLGDFREKVKAKIPVSKERQLFWRQTFSEQILAKIAQGNLQEAEDDIENALSRYRSQS